MFDDGNPKVIVDDDFLDLRNERSRYSRPRSPSTRCNTRGSSSVKNQENVNSVKEAFPGLKRIINSYNQRSSIPLCSKTANKPEIPVDNRFRRTIDKKALSSRSECILQDSESSSNGKENITKDTSESSDTSPRNNSNERKVSPQLDNSKNESLSNNKTEKERCENNKNNETNDKTGAVRKDTKNKRRESKKKTKLSPNKFQEEKTFDLLQDDLKKIQNAKKDNIKVSGGLDWGNGLLESSQPISPMLTFKKCWTIPSMPLMQKSLSWTKHRNVLCNKVDRETYEFDTDDTISESEDKISSYSSISRSNYMNLIFCLGCLCGIILIGGILTASEIRIDQFKTFESDEGMFTFFYEHIAYTCRVVFSICYQILTLPSTTLFRTEEPKRWSFFDIFSYFIPE